MKRLRAETPGPVPDRRPGAAAERDAETAARSRFAWSTGHADAPRARAGAEGTGRPVPPVLRRQLSRRFGTDLTGVRLHDDALGAEVARDRGAHALAEGRHVYAADGALAAGTAQGDGRLEHELAHVAQQTRSGGPAVSLADEETTGGGYGATAPEVAYEVAEGRAPEGAHILFGQDDIQVDEESLAEAVALLAGQNGPVIVELHGYASQEGREEYNLNLFAHRAARAKRELAPYLPAGSDVLLLAHGETGAFGRRYAPNRRVGLRIRPMPEPAARESTAAVPLNPRATQTTDPQPPVSPDPEIGGVRLPEGPATPPPPWLLPSIYRPHLDLGARDPLRLDLPILRPDCPFAPGTDQMDWFEIMRPLRGRGGQLSDDQTLSLIVSWQSTACTYTRMLTPILGPDLARTAAAKGVNLGLSSAMDQSAYWEHPTPADRFDLQLRREGIETTIIPVSDIILGIYRLASD